MPHGQPLTAACTACAPVLDLLYAAIGADFSVSVLMGIGTPRGSHLFHRVRAIYFSHFYPFVCAQTVPIYPGLTYPFLISGCRVCGLRAQVAINLYDERRSSTCRAQSLCCTESPETAPEMMVREPLLEGIVPPRRAPPQLPDTRLPPRLLPPAS